MFRLAQFWETKQDLALDLNSTDIDGPGPH